MADVTVTNPNSVVGVQPTVITANVAGDRFRADPGQRYLVRAANGHSAPQNIIVDDPTAKTPPGATAFNPDVTYVVPNGSAPANLRSFILDADRYADANGWINLTYSGVTLLTYEVYGPLEN